MRFESVRRRALLLGVLVLALHSTGVALAQTRCIPDPHQMCLNGSRFAVQVNWQDPTGQVGLASVVPFKSDSSGMFWFFSSDNWEMLIKVLDGCTINNHFWIFADATTNVKFSLNVTDTLTGASKVYSNSQGHAASPVIDIDAFAGCSASGGAADPPRGLVPEFGEADRSPNLEPDAAAGAGDESPCIADAMTGCLAGGRFRVAVDWKDPQGHTGQGALVPFGSDNSLVFYFFSADNWEMLVKILDGCSLNNHLWVFAAATTNVEYTLTVTDTFTGAVKQYINPQGHVSDAITDTSAFSTCSATSPAQISFAPGNLQTLTAVGQQSQLTLTVVDPQKDAIPGASVTWSSSNPELLQVKPTGPLTASVTALGPGPGSSTITATYKGLTSQSTLLMANLAPGTFAVTSDMIVALTPTTLTLRRDARTEQLIPNQVLVGVDGSGVLARARTVALTADQVVLQVSDASITDAYTGYAVDTTGTSVEVTGKLRPDSTGWSQSRRRDGQVERKTLLRGATCKAQNGTEPAGIDLSGAEIDFATHLTPHGSLHPGDPNQTFALSLEGSLDVTLQAPQITLILGQVSGAVTCTLPLSTLGLLQLSEPPFLLTLQAEPSVGVELGGVTFSAPTLTLSGPVGKFHGMVQIGIAYSQTSGWSRISGNSWSADINLPPPVPGIGAAAFTADAKAFAALDLGLKLSLGVPTLFRLPLAEAKIANAEAYGKSHIELKDPVDPVKPDYTGPEWSLGAGLKASLDPDLLDNILTTALRRLGVNAPIKLDLPLFDIERSLKESPKLTLATPGTFDLSQGGPLAVSATTDPAVDGNLEIDVMPATACAFTPAAQGMLSKGSGSASWTSAPGYIGKNQMRGLLRSDDLSAVIPYASNSVSALIANAGMYTYPTPEGCFQFKLGVPYAEDNHHDPVNTSITYWVTGGQAPYVWTLSGIPPGLHFTDTDTWEPPYPAAFLYDVPTQLGTFPLAVSVTDSAGNKVSFSPTVTVVPP